MRLWHQKLIPYLPRQQLLGQHRECCALRGKGWGKKHATVDYVFKYRPVNLIAYHYLVMDEMEKRGYHPDPIWRRTDWRGNMLGEEKDTTWLCGPALTDYFMTLKATDCMLYPEHNDEYLKECIDNLRDKGVDVSEMEKLLNGNN